MKQMTLPGVLISLLGAISPVAAANPCDPWPACALTDGIPGAQAPGLKNGKGFGLDAKSIREPRDRDSLRLPKENR